MKKDTRDLGWALEIWYDIGPGYIIKSKYPEFYEIEKAKAKAEGRLIEEDEE